MHVNRKGLVEVFLNLKSELKKISHQFMCRRDILFDQTIKLRPILSRRVVRNWDNKRPDVRYHRIYRPVQIQMPRYCYLLV